MISKEQKRLEAIAAVTKLYADSRSPTIVELLMHSGSVHRGWAAVVWTAGESSAWTHETIDGALTQAEMASVESARAHVAEHPELRDAFAVALRKMDEAKL
jgi:hypothetical protein